MSDGSDVLISGYPLSGIVRRVRRKADMSQRELAKHAGVSPTLIGAIETGTRTPSLTVLQRILNAANYQLVVVDADGPLAVPLEVWQDVTDGSGRRYPAHLDTILDPEFGEWWADGQAAPKGTAAPAAARLAARRRVARRRPGYLSVIPACAGR